MALLARQGRRVTQVLRALPDLLVRREHRGQPGLQVRRGPLDREGSLDRQDLRDRGENPALQVLLARAGSLDLRDRPARQERSIRSKVV